MILLRVWLYKVNSRQLENVTRFCTAANGLKTMFNAASLLWNTSMLIWNTSWWYVMLMT